MSLEIMTQAGIGHPTDWATQKPLAKWLFKKNKIEELKWPNFKSYYRVAKIVCHTHIKIDKCF